MEEDQNLPVRERKQRFKRNLKRIKHIKISLIVLTVILANILVILLSIACINKFNNNVYKNVYFMGKDLSGYTSRDINYFLEDKSDELINNSKISIYQNQENIYTVIPDDIKYELDIEKTAKSIITFGRTGNIVIDNFNILKALLSGKYEIAPTYKYDEESLNGLIKNIDLSINDRYVDDIYSVDEKKYVLVIVRGKTGNSIDYDTTKISILNMLNENKSITYEPNIIQRIPKKIEANQIHESIAREVKDAYIDEDASPVKFVSEVYGLDFNVEELDEFLNKPENNEETKSIEFPLQVTEPKVKLADITYTLYSDKLSGFTTYFDSTQKNRANNLQIAISYLNNVIIMPGEVFSYNKVVGETTEAKGYLPAATFKAGTIVQELGGGICQTSSTLYYVALLANMEIVERHQHGLPVAYIKPSLDATVYGDVLDFRFKNNKKYPVKIVASYSSSGSINISLFGAKEGNEFDIELTSKLLYYIPFETQYTYDNTMNENTQVIVSDGTNGYASEGYITKKQNGKVMSTTLLSKDVYKARSKIIKVGTKKVQKNTTDNSNNIDTYQ